MNKAKQVWGTVLFFILYISSVQASPKLQEDCFGNHLKDAIQLNQQRAPLYSELTHGESESLSSQLIWGERWALISAFFYDWRAGLYRKSDIPVLCDEFVPMDLVPVFKSYVPPQGRPIDSLPEVQIEEISKNLKRAIESSSFEIIYSESSQRVGELKEFPSYFCMSRHLLSSIARSAKQAPQHIQKALSLELHSPEPLLSDFIELQIDNLEEAYEMDREAFPFQKQGIPILCQDLPEIPF